MVEGDGVLRHEYVHDGFVAAQGMRREVADAIDRHIEQYFGPVEFVYHEFGSHLVGVHVYVIAPTEARPYWTLITSGMSELPMTVPAGVSPYAEVMLCLPADWPLDAAYPGESAPDWPIAVLKQVARLPHEYGTWIGEWHSVPNGDPAENYADDVPFCGVVVTPMLRVPAAARVITAPDGAEINLLAVIPLHRDEVAAKIERGTDALIEILDRGGVTELLDPGRPSFAVVE
ncbi:suppressor of fused domain protein [Actinoplanes philippinensis]|uniref:suppressor of fused domain protein n=1 Tax=Actinoplanes philippinensis TaxID=35752 RepID=UPI0033C5AFA1